MNHPDVLIVGAGPSGLMLACQLAMQNISFRIIDKTEDHTTQSRALVIQARSLELLDQMGIAPRAIENGQTARAIGAFFNGKKILRLIVNQMGGNLTKFPFFLMLEQSRTENILIDFLKARGHQVERRTELQTLAENGDSVTCRLKLPNGEEETVHAKFIVGADGAHSVVRQQLNIPFAGKTFNQSLFVLDCRADVDIPGNEMYLTFSKEALGGFFPLTNGRWRILGNIPEELEGKENITFADIEKNFAKRTNMVVRLYDPQWISAYHSHHRYASTFKKGHCFLIGDAAHIHSPVGAQGMNTGLQDACNLSWKLILVLKAGARPSLLDSYTEERITIAKKLVRSTDRIFNVVTSSNLLVKTIRLYVVPLMLKLVAPAFRKLTFLQRAAFKMISEIGIHYRKSSLSKGASFGTFPPSAPRPGDRLPYISMTVDGHDAPIAEWLQNRFFCVLMFSENPPPELVSCIETLKDCMSIQTIPETPETQTLYKVFGIKESGYYLIRPDGYIACRSQSMKAETLKTYLTGNLHVDWKN